MTVKESFARFGLGINPDSAVEIRQILMTESKKLINQEPGDTQLMRLCAVQLFGLGLLDDVLLIYKAKNSNMDADISIETPLLCGPGLEPTKAFLRSTGGPEALGALELIEMTESSDGAEAFDRDFILKDSHEIYSAFR